MNVTRLIILASGLVLSPGYLLAGENTDKYKAISELLVGQSRAPVDIMAMAGNFLRPLTHGRNYFEASDVEIYDQIYKARRRAQFISQSLAYDLDGNMEVSKDEVEKSVAVNFGGSDPSSATLKRAVDQIMQSDTNGDGKLSGDELGLPRQQSGAVDEPNINARLGKALLELDPNKDGRLTQAEILGILAHVAEVTP